MTVNHDSTVHTVLITNRDTDIINGFFYSQYIPNTITVGITEVKIDGQYSSDFVFEIEKPDIIYAGHTTHRWVFSEPTAFDGINLRPGQTAEIMYTTETPVNTMLHSFVGWFTGRKEAFFGYN